jgi:hypothetical protein
MVTVDGHAHDWSAEFDRRAWRWLDEALNGDGEKAWHARGCGPGTERL